MLLAAVAIPAFGVVVVALGAVENAAWPARFVISATCLSIVAMGRSRPPIARHVPAAAALATSAAMTYFAVRMHTGNVTPTHIVAFELIYVLPLMVMQTARAHLAYSALALGQVTLAYQGLEAPEVPFVASIMALLVLGVGTSMTSLARTRAEVELETNRLQLEERVDERTKQLEAEVRERRAAETDALRASRAKSAFLATMSHELRTPLNAIIGYTELVQDELSDLEQPQLADDLDKVRGSARHLLTMVSDVLDLSRIEAGELTLTHTDVDVADIMGQLERLIATERSRSGAELRIDVEPELWVHTDPDRLLQIVVNLVTNALKFTPEGTVAVQARRSGAHIELVVEDTGVGIAAEDLDRVFQTFVQVDGSTTRRRGGVGLGLALSKDLAQRLGGTLTARSTPGEGSIFTLRLPDAWISTPNPASRDSVRLQ